MKRPSLLILAFFLAQIILCLFGSRIFQKEVNPFALLVISAMFTVYCFDVFNRQPSFSNSSPAPKFMPWLHALAGVLGLFTAYEELRKIWNQYPDPGNISDVLPQLEALPQRFFAGEFPYQVVKLPTHEPFPVYMPLHWMPIQISNILHIDSRWSGIILLMIAVGLAGYYLSKSHPVASWRRTLPAMLLFVLPVWGFILWGRVDIAVSLEGIVAAWYILLAVGLAARNHMLIALGISGALLSRYTLLFWIPLFAILLWLHAPKKYSYWIWGGVTSAILLLFVLPFWMKDPSIISKITNYYFEASINSWVRPDEYSFRDALSLNIHLRQWLPGTPEENLKYSRFPQIGAQLIMVALGIYYYQKKWRHNMDVYTFSLLALSIMPMVFYIFSPMLFKYYMLMPLMVSAVVCWKAIAILSIPHKTRS